MTTSVPIFSPNLVPMLTGFVPTIVDTTHVALTPGMCSDSFARNYLISNDVLTIDTAVVGAGGIDVGPIAANSFYAILAIDSSIAQENSSMTNGIGLVAAMLTLAGTIAAPLAPTLPIRNLGGIQFGYDEYRVVGYVATDNSANLLPIICSGTNAEREFRYATPISVLSGGTAATFTAIDLVNGSSGLQIVPTVCDAALNFFLTADSANDSVSFLTHGVTSTTGMQQFTSPAAAASLGELTYIPVGDDSGVPAVDYQLTSTDDSLDVAVTGFKVSL